MGAGAGTGGRRATGGRATRGASDGGRMRLPCGQIFLPGLLRPVLCLRPTGNASIRVVAAHIHAQRVLVASDLAPRSRRQTRSTNHTSPRVHGLPRKCIPSWARPSRWARPVALGQARRAGRASSWAPRASGRFVAPRRILARAVSGRCRGRAGPILTEPRTCPKTVQPTALPSSVSSRSRNGICANLM